MRCFAKAETVGSNPITRSMKIPDFPRIGQPAYKIPDIIDDWNLVKKHFLPSIIVIEVPKIPFISIQSIIVLDVPKYLIS